MVIVLGGGLSGLSASYYLLKKYGAPSSIFEMANRIGGWIRTENHNEKNFFFEYGPRTIKPKGERGANTLAMIEDLNLKIESIVSTHEVAKNRLIYAKGELCLLPNSIGSIFRTIPPFTRPIYSALFNDLRTNRKIVKYGDESIYSFVSRRFGREFADYAISPLICGICAGDAKEISVRFLLEELFELEQRFGGVIKGIFLNKFFQVQNNLNNPGLFLTDNKSSLYNQSVKEKWSMYHLKNGLEMLPKALGQYLNTNRVEINLSSECRSIFFSNGKARLKIRNHDLETNHVISSIPSYRLAACVKDQHPGLCGQLMAIPYVDVAVVNLQYNINTEELLPKTAFGFLVPPIEKRPVLGVTFDSCCFEMESNTVLTVMMGGKWFEDYFGTDPTKKDIRDVALKEVKHILGINQEPKLARVHILKKCIPQYTVGHNQLVDSIRRYIRRYQLPLSLCGAAYDGVSINDVILSARNCIIQLPKL